MLHGHSVARHGIHEQPHRPDVPEGTYILNIVARNHLFDQVGIVRSLPRCCTTNLSPQYRIDVVDSLSPPEIRPYLPGTPLSSTANSPITIAYPLNVHPRYKNEYFVPKQSFNVMGMLQNPMIMMMGVVGIMVVALPYMMVRSLSLAARKRSWGFIINPAYYAEKSGSRTIEGSTGESSTCSQDAE